MTDKLKKHGWTIGKWATLFGGLASLILILDSKTFGDAISPWMSQPSRIARIEEKVAEIQKEQQAHNKAVDHKLNLLLSAQGILAIDEWAETNTSFKLVKNYEHK